ncbi:MAG: hypothetical protein QOK05_1084 [Chloroflexota bacterium]|jgi:hypothetical protein|nr:hypothetical protein [Chloroflexota bacterium]
MKLRALAASATLAGTAILSVSTAEASVPSTAGGQAIQYLGTQQQADGSIDHSLGETADYALGAKYQGIDPNTLQAGSGKTVYDYFTTWVGASVSCAAVGNARDGNTIGKLVQAVLAGGHDPTAFAGRNLLADLEGPSGTTGGAYDATTGTYADCVSFNAGTGQHDNAVYAQANAILALDGANNATYPVPPAAIGHLRNLQGGSGGWATFGSDNTNATAMALMALGARVVTYCAAPLDPTLSGALAYLHGQQDPGSGGFPYTTTFGPGSDPDSDGLVIQALVAVGQDPAGAAWTNSTGKPTTDVLTFQDATTGGFKFDHGASTKPDAFTTSEVTGGLDRAPFPKGNPPVQAVACPVPAPTPSPAATPLLPRAGSGPARPGAPRSGLVVTMAVVALTTLLGTALVMRVGTVRDG